MASWPGQAAASCRWSQVLAAGAAIFMAQLDSTIVTVALPTMRAELHVSAHVVEWVVLSYLVPLISFALFWGRLLDRASTRAVATAACGGFALASAALAVAPDMVALVVTRTLQGVFAAALLAAAPVIAVQAVREPARGRALGIVSALGPAGAMAGPAAGGELINAWGWRAIFLINVPIAIAVGTVTGWGARAPGRGRPTIARLRAALRTSRSEMRLWIVEVVLLAVAVVVALGAFSIAADDGVGWLALVFVAGIPLWWWQRSPIGRPVWKHIAGVETRAPYAAMTAAYTAVLAVQFLLPFFLQHVLHEPVTVVGWTLLAYPAASSIGGAISGVVIDVARPGSAALVGGLLLACGLAMLTPLSGHWSASAVVWRLLVVGFGFGLLVTACQAMVMASGSGTQLGLASATSNVARQAGLALGPALATLAWGLDGYHLAGMRAALVTVTATALAGLLFIARREMRPRIRAGTELVQAPRRRRAPSTHQERSATSCR